MSSADLTRVLVLTLYCGEGELEQCRASVAGQEGVAVEHRVFEHLPNREAHDRLYRTIMEESGRFDAFVKLDADMALADPAALGRLLEPFRRIEGLDHLVAAVDDWMTGTDMIGVHAFSPRVRWCEHGETLFVDPDPEFPGLQLVEPAPRPPVARHAFDSTPLQAFHFGVHRALQAVQRGRSPATRRPHNAALQMVVLDRVWRRFVAVGDRRHGLAVLGADLVFRDAIRSTANDYADPDLRARLTEVAELDAAALELELGRRWAGVRRRWASWWLALDPSMRAAVVRRLLRDGLTWPVRRTLAGRARRPRSRWG